MIKLIILSLAAAAFAAPQLVPQAPAPQKLREDVIDSGIRTRTDVLSDMASVEARIDMQPVEDKKFRRSRSLRYKREEEMPVVQEALEFLARDEEAIEIEAKY